MHKYEHTQLIARILRVDDIPDDSEEFSGWIKAAGHLKFIADNAMEDELVVRAYGPFMLISSAFVPNELLSPPDFDDLLGWSFSPPEHRSSYVSGGEREGIEVEHGFSGYGSDTLAKGQDFIFYRTFEGWTGKDRNYFEVLQEFAHLAGIHWREEHGAYCRINSEGDLDPVLSISFRGYNREDVSLASVSRDVLDEYLAASKTALVQMFDFTLLRYHNFPGWGDGSRGVEVREDELAYTQELIPGIAAYTRGVRIIRPRAGYEATNQAMLHGWHRKEQNAPVEFIALDWRNNVVRKISTEKSATTNYFTAKGNDLPFELSPAFFRPEVLSKYKADREKYTVETRSIHCRAAWALQSYDINEAGQVHTYICYLRNLPYREQLHWLSHNEAPKAAMSQRAISTDFRGEWTDEIDPLDDVKSLLRDWSDQHLTWWRVTSGDAFDNVTKPVTASKDEWAGAFLDLSHLVIEGFRTKPIRIALDANNVSYSRSDGSIALLEKLGQSKDPQVGGRFEALRTIQRIRSKVKGHSGSSDADAISKDALRQHGTYGAHFAAVCLQLKEELYEIAELLSS